MQTDKASCNSKTECKDLISGHSEHVGAPIPLVNPAPDSKVDPYQDPAYNQPQPLVETLVVETSMVETPVAKIPKVEASDLSPAMQACIDECFECHKICLTQAMHEGSATGEMHPNPDFFRLMINCAEICQTSANFLLTSSPLHGPVCDACAQTCEACAQSCDEMGHLAECAAQCRKCAASCREMAQMTA